MLPTDPWPETAARARQLDELGFDHLWTYDHLSWRRYRDRPWHATVPWLTGVAAVTTRIRIGTLVASPNIRHPVMLAKDAMTLDHISGGRLTLGVGAGGPGFDATVFGTAAPSPAQRAARLAEFVELLDALLREPVTTFAGAWYSANEARMLPGCVQQPRVPLALAAEGPKTLAVTARFADAWIAYGGMEGEARDAISLMARLDDACAAIGRDPASVARIYIAGDDERACASLEAFRDVAGRAEAAGFSDLVVHHPRADDPVWDDPVENLVRIAAETSPGDAEAR
jgi:alkanesulfonate monooxygenase SsuD/methylene tetrahydromethanopterin reductase-like flavin-dependent oxidoreductase (luciferase family)